MWTAFKGHLLEGIEQHVPIISKFYDWLKPSWKCPLPKNVREKIKIKHRLRNRYLDTKNVDFFRKFKKIRNEIRKIIRHVHKNEQIEVAKTAKSNSKKFWAYVKNKTSSSTIGDIKDKDTIIFEDDKKASVFCRYFSSAFTIYHRR